MGEAWANGGALAILAGVIAMLGRQLWNRGSDEIAQSDGWRSILAAKDAEIARLAAKVEGLEQALEALSNRRRATDET